MASGTLSEPPASASLDPRRSLHLVRQGDLLEPIIAERRRPADADADADETEALLFDTRPFGDGPFGEEDLVGLLEHRYLTPSTVLPTDVLRDAQRHLARVTDARPEDWTDMLAAPLAPLAIEHRPARDAVTGALALGPGARFTETILTAARRPLTGASKTDAYVRGKPGNRPYLPDPHRVADALAAGTGPGAEGADDAHGGADDDDDDALALLRDEVDGFFGALIGRPGNTAAAAAAGADATDLAPFQPLTTLPGANRGLVFDETGAPQSTFAATVSLPLAAVASSSPPAGADPLDGLDFPIGAAADVVDAAGASPPPPAPTPAADESATPAAPSAADAVVDAALTRPVVKAAGTGTGSRGQADSPDDDVAHQWAHEVDVREPFPDFASLVPDMAMKYPFELDTFQKRAVYYLEQGENVFVAAHTSAGKTVVAEYAIALAAKHMTRAIYTSPIKALSNQKFRDFQNTFQDVGILTGDVQIRPEASCLVMTTEILRSMLYRGADLIRDVEFVIFDEVHYISDAERGVVWEEVIIMLPPHITLILLSATVSNTFEFAEWVGRTKRHVVHVISTPFRPVPLQHFIYTGAQEKCELFLISENKTFITEGYNKALASLAAHKPPASGSKNGSARASSTRGGPAGARGGAAAGARGRGGRGAAGGGRGGAVVPARQTFTAASQFNNQIRTGYVGAAAGAANNAAHSPSSVLKPLIHYLERQELLPVIVFCFSRMLCQQAADGLGSRVDLTGGKAAKSEIRVFVDQSLTRLSPADRQLPQVVVVTGLLMRGIAVHHSGLLPILKEVVEILFTRGLVKVLFATETFAMGVNAPARCVIFSSVKKWNGTTKTWLNPGEYTQMSGRAGRRGLDTTGMVIIAAPEELPDASVLHTMILSRPTKLDSQFRSTFNMQLNLASMESFKIEDMISRSFSENAFQKQAPGRERLYNATSEALKMLPPVTCFICEEGDLEGFHALCMKYRRKAQQLSLTLRRLGLWKRSVEVGRVVVIDHPQLHNAAAVILQTKARSVTINPAIGLDLVGSATEAAHEEDIMLVYAMCDASNVTPADATVTAADPDDPAACLPKPSLPISHVQRPPQRTRRFMLVKLHVDHILVLTTRHMESGLTQKITAYNVETGSASLVRPHDALMAFASDVLAHHEVPMLDFPKYRDIDIRTPIEECQAIVRQLAHFGCLLCPDLLDHYGTVDVRVALKAQLREIALRLDTANLSHMEDYHRRMLILKHLQYVDDHDIVQLKGRIAVEINTVDSICLTEMLLDNIFADLTPAEVAGLLSSLVFQERSGQDVGASTLEPRLAEGIKQMQRVVANVNAVKSQYELDDIQEVDETIRTGIVDVVYQWAQGVSFGELTRMTTVMEGTLVRNIVRLNETLREVGDAARILGNHALYTKMEAASEAIRRDIVFASSLYF